MGFGVHDHPPGPAQKSVNTLDALHAPGLDGFERSHEHLVKPQAIGAILGDNGVGIDHVAPALGHLVGTGIDTDLGILVEDERVSLLGDLGLHQPDGGHQHRRAGILEDMAVFDLLDIRGGNPLSRWVFVAGELHLAQDHPLVDQPLERLRRADQAAVEEHLVPEPAIKQVQDRVLGAADVKIDGHPVLLLLRIPGPLAIPRIEVTEIVPARPGPLGHGVGLAAVPLGVTHPVLCLGERWLGLAGRLEVVEPGQEHRQLGFGDGPHPVARVQDDRKWLAPVPLARE